MIGFSGFNVGVNISLGDMETALDYINDGSIYKEDIEKLRMKRQATKDTTVIELEAEVGIKEPVTLKDYNNDHYEEDTDLNEYDYEDEEDDDFDSYFDEEDTEEDEEFDFGDEELDFDEEDGGYGDEECISEEYNDGTKSERELELERQLSELKGAEEKRLKQEKVNQGKLEQLNLQRERERKLEEKINGIKQQRDEELIKNKGIEAGEGGNNAKETKDRSTKSNKGTVVNGGSTGTSVSNNKPPSSVASGKHGERLVNANRTGVDYSILEIDALWAEVRKFMLSNGVQSKLISKKLVEDKFGANNIRKLYLKGYLIPFGSRLTIGK